MCISYLFFHENYLYYPKRGIEYFFLAILIKIELTGRVIYKKENPLEIYKKKGKLLTADSEHRLMVLRDEELPDPVLAHLVRVGAKEEQVEGNGRHQVDYEPASVHVGEA